MRTRSATSIPVLTSRRNHSPCLSRKTNRTFVEKNGCKGQRETRRLLQRSSTTIPPGDSYYFEEHSPPDPDVNPGGTLRTRPLYLFLKTMSSLPIANEADFPRYADFVANQVLLLGEKLCAYTLIRALKDANGLIHKALERDLTNTNALTFHRQNIAQERLFLRLLKEHGPQPKWFEKRFEDALHEAQAGSTKLFPLDDLADAAQIEIGGRTYLALTSSPPEALTSDPVLCAVDRTGVISARSEESMAYFSQDTQEERIIALKQNGGYPIAQFLVNKLYPLRERMFREARIFSSYPNWRQGRSQNCWAPTADLITLLEHYERFPNFRPALIALNQAIISGEFLIREAAAGIDQTDAATDLLMKTIFLFKHISPFEPTDGRNRNEHIEKILRDAVPSYGLRKSIALIEETFESIWPGETWGVLKALWQKGVFGPPEGAFNSFLCEHIDILARFLNRSQITGPGPEAGRLFVLAANLVKYEYPYCEELASETHRPERLGEVSRLIEKAEDMIRRVARGEEVTYEEAGEVSGPLTKLYREDHPFFE